ncbi:hypothetical protein [Rhodococcoides corynebacterioides]|uniref:Uncharacterized protein n=1 Tax=Rhodococcoides corynebacterioides TaxID=53972 RepID=A0ABS7P4I4_9NOCA|nr:hypothetical protein [Rhodococcus corynebacterioides]MBY6366926.1 hypothetical protein [Rhodococcus corynebacterioides]MBY6407728.1 hypothetical protein [Rhodococcus corynebacterioides]
MGSGFFDQFQPTDHRRLIMRIGRAGMFEYSMFFREAANRLAASFTGVPFDDTILIPWLYLHRHAAELTLKSAIVEATRLRRAGGDHDPSLSADETKDRLRKTLGHKLVPLLDELDDHLLALDLTVTDAKTRKALARLAQLDPAGESFRYAGTLSERDDRADFLALDAAMREMSDLLAATMDVLDHYADMQRDMAEFYYDYNADLAPDLADYMDL